ncbi:uncharacterized protein mipepb [Carassius gibelio]|uniref:uncharacterized protein mipepb n=1 Tax=Carassius gibelio TaxID=101364 RepID=UPI0022792D7B|nr:uncharacterized protein mipepb [Carassius gibelio]
MVFSDARAHCQCQHCCRSSVQCSALTINRKMRWFSIRLSGKLSFWSTRLANILLVPVETFDQLSDRVADLADFIKVAHPDATFQKGPTLKSKLLWKKPEEYTGNLSSFGHTGFRHKAGEL